MDKPALVSLTFDDGLRCQFEQGVPILDQHGLPATFFLVANTDPVLADVWAENHGFKWPKIDWSEKDIQLLKGMVQRGHEIGSHTINHNFQSIAANPDFEARESKQRIEKWMGIEIPSFCYPFYRTIDVLKGAAIKAEYRQARTGAGNSYYAPQSALDWLGIDCREISNKERENVAAWVKPGCWHILTFHGIGGEQDGWEPITVSEFTRQMLELVKLRDSGAVEVVTFKDGADRLRKTDCQQSMQENNVRIVPPQNQ
jgi:peptidoglycan/xylan/chitin deacetylase (PgdA/CDA1 family)